MKINKELLPVKKCAVVKSLLPSITAKALNSTQKRELAEIDRLLDEMEKEDLFSGSLEEESNTQKAAGHKYIRKYKVGGKWRYVYANKGDRHTSGSQISHGRLVGKDEHIQPGSSFSLGPNKGHAVIERVRGNQIFYKIDGKGERLTASKNGLKRKILEAHRTQVESHAKSSLLRRQNILERAERVDPKSKQSQRARQELSRWMSESKDFLPRQKDFKLGDSVFVHDIGERGKAIVNPNTYELRGYSDDGQTASIRPKSLQVSRID